jgi:hypothetical protein
MYVLVVFPDKRQCIFQLAGMPHPGDFVRINLGNPADEVWTVTETVWYSSQSYPPNHPVGEIFVEHSQPA